MREALGVQVVQGVLEVVVPALLVLVGRRVVDALAAVEDPLQPDLGVLCLPRVELGLEFFESPAVELGADEVEAFEGEESAMFRCWTDVTFRASFIPVKRVRV